MLDQRTNLQVVEVIEIGANPGNLPLNFQMNRAAIFRRRHRVVDACEKESGRVLEGLPLELPHAVHQDVRRLHRRQDQAAALVPRARSNLLAGVADDDRSRPAFATAEAGVADDLLQSCVQQLPIQRQVISPLEGTAGCMGELQTKSSTLSGLSFRIQDCSIQRNMRIPRLSKTPPSVND